MVALYRSGGYIERAIRPFGGGAAGFAQRTGALRRGSQGPEGAGAGRLRQPARHPPGLCGAGPALSSRQERRGPPARAGFAGRDFCLYTSATGPVPPLKEQGTFVLASLPELKPDKLAAPVLDSPATPISSRPAFAH